MPSSRGSRRGQAGGDVLTRRRMLGLAVVLCVSAIVGWLIFRDARTPAVKAAGPTRELRVPTPGPLTHDASRPRKQGRVIRVPRRSPAVGLRIIRVTEPGQVIRVNGTTEPRTLTAIIRYPAQGPPGAVDLLDAPFVRPATRLPLILFGHGFAVTPAPYSRLLAAWARAGYVVAAPVFPLENANAPGGPRESDLVNQPRDMSFVISNLLAAAKARGGVFAGTIDPQRIAVAGQSDGGDTALAAAFDPTARDPRVKAAVILSGAEDPFAPAFAFDPTGIALLATQGTADTVNPPSMTDAFFSAAASPKFLLELSGASHQPPYTQPGPELTTVTRVTITFLNAYLKLDAIAKQRLLSSRIAGKDALLRISP